jgi:hypothetical protein
VGRQGSGIARCVVEEELSGGRAGKESRSRTAWRVCFPSRLALAIAVFACVLAPAALVVVHIEENPLFSPVDEGAHWDYVVRLADGGFPRLGQYLQTSTVEELACRGTAGQLTVPRCIKPPFPKDLYYQYESQQPPGYYAVTVPLRWFAMRILGLDDLTGTRMAGVIWLTMGLSVMWVAGRVLSVDPRALGAGVVLIATAPLVIYQSASVSNDDSDILIGALVLLVSALAFKHRGRWTAPALLATGLLATVFKLTDLLPVLVGSVLFALWAGAESRTMAGPGGTAGERTVGAVRLWCATGGALLLGGLCSTVGWIVIYRRLAIINPKDLPTFTALRASYTGVPQILGQAVSMLGPLTDSLVAFRTTIRLDPSNSAAWLSIQSLMSTLLRYLVLAGGLAGLFVRRRTWSHWLGLVTVPVLYIGGVALGFSIVWAYDSNPGLNGRYGLPLVPMLVLALVASVRGVWVVRCLWALGLVTLLLSFCYMLVA